MRQATATEGRAGDVHIYLDGSGSMSGFVNSPKPGSNALWIMNAVIQSLPSIVTSTGGKAFFYRSGDGRTVDQAQVDKALTEQQLKETVRPSWYNGKDAPLDVPLAQALLRKPEDLTIVITDLFLSDAELAGEPFYALKRPLEAALRSNKAIGILGVRHSFNGAIYDLPGRPPDYVYRDANARPLMLLMIGSASRILTIKERLDSEFLRERADQSRFVVFTAGANLGFRGIDGWGDRYIQASDRVTVSRSFDTNFPGTKFPKIEFSRRIDVVEGRLPLSDLWLRHAIQPTELRMENSIWWLERPSARRCEDRWDGPVELQSQPLSASLDSSMTAKIELMPSDMRDDLINGRYLIVSRLSLSGLHLDPVATWLSEWGFNPPDTEPLLARKPMFFPALNLARLGRALRDALSEAMKATPIAEFAVGVQLGR